MHRQWWWIRRWRWRRQPTASIHKRRIFDESAVDESCYQNEHLEFKFYLKLKITHDHDRPTDNQTQTKWYRCTQHSCIGRSSYRMDPNDDENKRCAAALSPYVIVGTTNAHSIFFSFFLFFPLSLSRSHFLGVQRIFRLCQMRAHQKIDCDEESRWQRKTREKTMCKENEIKHEKLTREQNRKKKIAMCWQLAIRWYHVLNSIVAALKRKNRRPMGQYSLHSKHTEFSPKKKKQKPKEILQFYIRIERIPICLHAVLGTR